MAIETFKDENRLSLPRLLSRQLLFRILRIGLGLGALGLIGRVLWVRLHTVISRQGVVNAPVITVRSPLEGHLTLDPLEPGTLLSAQTLIGQVTNPRQAQLVVDRQRILSEIQNLQSQLQTLQAQQQSRQILLRQFEQELRQQQRLQLDFQGQQVNQRQSDLVAAESAAAVATRAANRYEYLAQRGAVAQAIADQAIATAEQAAATVERQRAALAQAQAEQQAAAQGLQLDGARVLSYPAMRVRELEIELDDLRQTQLEWTAALQARQRERDRIEQQLALEQSAAIEIPMTGVIWSVINPTGLLGEHVEAGADIVQLLDCQKTWVDAFVAEREVDHLQVGDTVQVRFLSQISDEAQVGTVESIRAGVGRTMTGEDVAVPPPERVRREVAVRVVLPENRLSPAEFCGVGRSVEVTFPKF